MQELIDAILAAMQASGFSVVSGGNFLPMPKLTAAKTAVSLKRAVCKAPVSFCYLGTKTLENGLTVPLYGCKAENEAEFQVCAPRRLGAAACEAQAQALMRLLLGGVDGVQIRKLELGPCVFEPEADVFSAKISLVAEGFIYALANEDDTEFTDFILKGDIQ